MNTVLVTIVGPEGRTDAAAPADTPVRDLLGTFAQLTGAGGVNGAAWDIRPPGRAPLRDDGTLGAQGVVDGCVLHLRPRGEAPPAVVAPRTPQPPREDGATPVQRTRETLPEWLGLPARLRAACRADVAGTAAEGRAWPARVRAGWRAGDYDHRLEECIRARRLGRPVTIAVVSPSGAAGRSTIAALLGSLLAHVRVDRTVLLDTAPAGTGARRHVAVADLAGMLDSGLTQTQLDAYLVPATDGLTVLPLAPGATAADHERAFARMRELASIVVVDCGPGLADPAAQAALAAADQLVVVVEAGAGAREDVATAAAALGDGAPPAVLVVNAIAPRGHDVGWLEHEIPRARGLIAVHSDPRRAAQLRTGELTWSARNGAWDQPLRELAALLSSEWVCLGLAARR